MQKRAIDFCKFSSIKIGGISDVDIITECNDDYNGRYIIGSCNNILIGTQPPPLAKLSKRYDYIKEENGTLKIGAATPSGKIFSYCKKHDIADLEFLSYLPGTLGGLVFMNAGLKEYEIFNILSSILTCKGALNKAHIKYGYRYTNIDSLILEATFELRRGFDGKKVRMFRDMRKNQPSTPSAGSCFKNPKGDYAGRLIEAVGLKGFRVGNMEFSKEHANFLVNLGGGSFDDAVFLIQEAQKKVYEKFDVWLECEIKVLDERYMGKKSSLIHP